MRDKSNRQILPAVLVGGGSQAGRQCLRVDDSNNGMTTVSRSIRNRAAAWLIASAFAVCSFANPGLSRPADLDVLFSPVGREQPISDRPNVIIIMTDDVGYAASRSFGGLIDTQTFDRLAETGLRFNNFHTTPLCSPTRAALLTGRNPHAVGMGTITERAADDDGYITAIPRSAATIARVLRDHDYHTAMIGKYHLLPKWELKSVGHKPHWPNAMGFDYFYGFEAALTDQYTPELFENMNYVQASRSGDYILDRDLADKAIAWLREVRSSGQGKPFFLYYAPGTAHAPVQAPEAWIAKYRGHFDMGWDEFRHQVFERQKKLGIVPANTRLSERDGSIPAWSDLTEQDKAKFARFMEVYAAALSYADYQVGRILDDLAANDELDNTVIFYLQGDNGASPAGRRNGLVNWYNALNAIPEDPERGNREIDLLGGRETAPAIPIGWAHALSTPFRKWKGDPRYRGGMANGLVVSWPNGIGASGEIRHQFTSVSDIVPTIYELLSIEPPLEVDGARQQPLNGQSFAGSFAYPPAHQRGRVQYFENFGQVGFYSAGWWAASKAPSGSMMTSLNLHSFDWELYDLEDDFAQTTNLAKQYPQKLAELKADFAKEATANQVFPVTLDHRLIENSSPLHAPGRHTLFPGAEHYFLQGFPSVTNRSWEMTAKVTVPEGGGSGVVVSEGGRFAGWALVFLEGVPQFVYRYDNTDEATLIIQPSVPLHPGQHSITISVEQDGKLVEGDSVAGLPKMNDGVEISMSVGDEVVGGGSLKTSPGNDWQFQGAAIGHSNGDSLLPSYAGRFAFNGMIEELSFILGPETQPR